MADVLDLLYCERCGTYYVPKYTVTGRVLAHCRVPPGEVVKTVRWYDGEVEIDFEAIERRVVAYLLTEGVVGSRLTGSLLDIEV
jgi:hypothetical protein